MQSYRHLWKIHIQFDSMLQFDFMCQYEVSGWFPQESCHNTPPDSTVCKTSSNKLSGHLARVKWPESSQLHVFVRSLCFATVWVLDGVHIFFDSYSGNPHFGTRIFQKKTNDTHYNRIRVVPKAIVSVWMTLLPWYDITDLWRNIKDYQ